MSKWTHAICEECWDERYPEGRTAPLGHWESNIEHCCFCGRHTSHAIYIREDPTKVPHPPSHP